MFRNFILLLCLMAISACFAETKKSPIKNLDTCEPPSSFNPIFSKIALDGTFVFFEKKLQYFYNILDNDWSCEKPKLNVVNFFSTNSTEVLYKTIKKNDVYKINEIQIKKDDMFGFKSFVIKKCKSQGLSYLFEIRNSEDETIYGCQLNPNISNAVMWKQASQSSLIDVAYINIYQPFIDKMLELN